MVDVVGHLGMALIWLAPVWFVVDEARTAATFVGVGVWFGLLPDADLYLERTFGTVQHHGVFHTILLVSVVAAVLGPLLGVAFRWTADRTGWIPTEIENEATVFGVLAIWIPGLSHVFADMLSAPDIAQAIEPAWPLYRQSIGVDLVWYNNSWFNWGLLVAGIGLNLALYWSWTADVTPLDGSR